MRLLGPVKKVTWDYGALRFPYRSTPSTYS